MVTQFDWLVTQQLFVTWTILGHGGYGPGARAEGFSWGSPVDRAVDVYLDECVKVPHLQLGVAQ